MTNPFPREEVEESESIGRARREIGSKNGADDTRDLPI
jgi:hypothetical protein